MFAHTKQQPKNIAKKTFAMEIKNRDFKTDFT